MITSRLSSKSQTTIPQAVRTALKLREGDELVYTLEPDGRVLITRAAQAADDPFATFDEWDSEADRKAYANL
jgi:antitoxin PrlF